MRQPTGPAVWSLVSRMCFGSDTVAKNRELLRKNGITHDSPTEDITSILYDVFDYFEDVRLQGGRVLVHCCQGVSRSTSLVIAYLMWREGQSFEDAYHYVKNARRVTNPNMGFACRLLMCQKRVVDVHSNANGNANVMLSSPNSVLTFAVRSKE
ncbi:hypothetical protein TSUD_240470 [Trifolium subterraneum]|uniref:Tyrosine specific protein phosphatases domain-containing protein n=1 Tax=Trifolium subterraneum TaxID=3900 RepID=A0A2Z6NFT9_TRISU|nr:hypothetical protein TSUD_240470 [Trifolium subterraneum]